jgi:hypothetical protein
MDMFKEAERLIAKETIEEAIIHEQKTSELNAALEEVQKICDDWNEIKEKRGEWLFNYKLYDLWKKCDYDKFEELSQIIRDDWDYFAREAAGYAPAMWKYHEYFEHDRHNGS